MGRNYEHLSREELISLLQARDRRDETKFGLVWEANEIERDKALNSDFIALDLDPRLSVGEAPWRNLIIEGDNFDALRHLKMTFSGRIKCIYIDPPYNTGNKDFVYNDHFVEKEDLWRHSTWCEFIFQRLSLARDLLTEDGVIFVSIDDNEMPALGMIMKRVFGENKFVATLIWRRRTTSDSRNLNGVSADHEYVLCYQGGSTFKMRGREKDLTKYTNPDNDPNGDWMSDNLTGLANAKERPNLHYDIVHPVTGTKYPPHPTRGWIYGRERMDELIATGRILWPNKPTGRPRLKRYLTDMLSDSTGFSTILTSPGNVEATKELNGILGEKAFTFPKPTDLIAEIIGQSTSGEDIVLDFFAGSGTTAHAVLKRNLEDGSNRRFILVSSTEATSDSPEKNLCRDVCAERVRRVIAGYRNTKQVKVTGLGGDFAYLRCRKLAPSRLLEIEHEQVWTALQLIHRPSLVPYKEAPFRVAEGGDDATLIYVPRFHKKILPKLRETVMRHAAVVIYSWQPGLLLQHLRADHVQHEAIPESLARRFGLKS